LIGGARVVIYSNDHRPAHVHVISGDCEAVFNLHCPDGPPELRENYGFSRGAIRSLRARLREALEALCQEWNRIHGEP
jgi:Fe2+ or Zn2+ uptake regulation protein